MHRLWRPAFNRHSCGANATYDDFNIQRASRALQLLEGFTMLRQSCFQVRVPVVPGMSAWMLVIRMRNTARFEKGMPASIVFQQMILDSTVE